jgi:5-methyltetrahydropteroyltriglutamate--homocysteine methyltransferase
MKRSTERILTTHTGSLPRPSYIVEHSVEGRDQRLFATSADFDQQVKRAVSDIVRTQVNTGLDVISDGEMSKSGFSTYITERVTGFDGAERAQPPTVEVGMFPEYYAQAEPQIHPACNGPVAWKGDEFIDRDIATLRAALKDVAPTEVFMPAVSPGQVCFNFPNDYYRNEEAYILAVADAMKHEYRKIVGAGFLLQLDSPDLALCWGHQEFADKSYADYRKLVAQHVAAINHALEGLPRDRVRLHMCWGNAERPHTRDVPIAEIIDVVYGANVGAYSFEGSNPRHAHEWKIFSEHKLPDGKLIIPGTVDTLTNFVEHPELVAERIERYANIVGRENVIAGTDCGFSTRVRSRPRVHPTIAWAKLASLVEGAKLASKRLWT